MKLFIDTANIAEIREVASMGVICGVTTNPSLIAREGRNFHEVIREIAALVDGPISGEVSPDAEKAPEMIEEGKEIAALHPNMVVKIPMTAEGLKACAQLSAAGIRVNMTLIFSAGQALLAARAGAAFVSPFVGRLNDISTSGAQLVDDISHIYAVHNIAAEIIAASIRTPKDVLDCALARAHIATVPYAVLRQMIRHPLTDLGLEAFRKDWQSAFPG